MKKIITIYLLLITGFSAFAQGIPDPLNEQAGTLGFVQNVGQLANENGNSISGEEIFFHSVRTLPLSYYFNNKVSFSFPKIDDDTSTIDSLRRLDMTWRWSDVGNDVEPTAFDETSEKYNFYFAHCTSGCDQLSKFKGLLYENIYDGIDLRVYSNSTWIKMYFVIHPGVDPELLRLSFNGQDTEFVSSNILRLELGNYSLYLPSGIAYQYDAIGTTLLPWQPQFVDLGAGQVKLDIAGTYNNTKTLVYEISMPASGGNADYQNIDKSLLFGGADAFWDIDTDTEGNPYVSGYTWNWKTNIYPTNTYTTGTGTSDIAVVKFNESDMSVAWVTYYGGSLNEGNNWYGISLDNTNKTYISAPTGSAGTGTGAIPLPAVSGGYYDNTNTSASTNSIDQVIARFSTTGQLTGATLFGGYESSSLIPQSGDIIVDKSNNNIYVGAVDKIETELTNPGGGYYKTVGTNYIVKFNSSFVKQWCTYFGDNNADNGAQTFTKNFDICDDGKLIMTGYTAEFNNNSFNVDPGNTSFFQSNFGGGTYDGFITKFDGNDFGLTWSTYIGSSASDRSNRINVNPNTDIISISGNSEDDDFPSAQSGTNPFTQAYEGSSALYGGAVVHYKDDAFVSTFDGSSLAILNSTYLGGTASESSYGLASNPTTGDLYVLGGTRSNDFPQPTITQPPYLYEYPTSYNRSMVFITGFSSDFELSWSTYFGAHAISNDNINDAFSAKYTNPYLYMVGRTQDFYYQPTLFPTVPPQFISTISNQIGFITRFEMASTPLNMENNLKVNNKKIDFYPNPATNNIFINFDSKTNPKGSLLSIYNCVGSEIKKVSIQSNVTNTQIEIGELTQGVYLLELLLPDGSKIIEKFIKQ